MIHFIWGLLLVVGVLAGVYEGRLEHVGKAVLEGAEGATKFCLVLLGGMALWLGFMRLAEEAGMLRVLQRWMRPVTRRLFPSVPVDHPAHSYISSSIIANLFGLPNATMPSGIKAMHQLQELNPDKTTSTPAMCTFSSLITSGLTLMPISMLVLRSQYHSKDPTAIIVPSLMATVVSTVAALLLDWVFRRCTTPRPFSGPSDKSKL
ncbi:nucleoside recognition domain-containing protein [Pasteuria penetrans]|uniref:nucleoside recognition domain-containing protein n=1 Tax=Pasteuria penetrans TaxID=86005 RepID=UPI000FAD1464|nr:nucleoside recognition domain-containing protein [Pasteuria penetrans]